MLQKFLLAVAIIAALAVVVGLSLTVELDRSYPMSGQSK